MNQAKEYKTHRYIDGELVEIIPTQLEARLAKRLSSTFYMMIREAKRAKRPEAVYVSDVLGTIHIKPYLRGKKRYTRLSMPSGELTYEEMRSWVTLALQYLMGEYPMITFDMEYKACDICFMSNKTLWDIEVG